MTARPLVLVIAGMLALASHAAPPPAPPENLPAAMSRQVEDVVALKQKTTDAAAALRKWYETSLDTLKKNALAKGDLDAVLAVDGERQRMERDLTEQEKAGLPPASLQVRNQFDQARATQAAQEKSATLVLLRGYVAALDGLEKRLTQKGDIDAALATRKEKAAAAQQLSNATPLPGDLLAAEGPKPAAPPATPATGPRPPVATPPATPPLLASRTTPAPGGLFKGPAPAFKVAAELKAKGTIKEPLPDAIAFDAPKGDGRHGAKGVLIKNDQETGKFGSTWTFSYARSQSAGIMQIVHPHGRGQVIISVKTKDVSLATPTSWSQVSWNGTGDPKKLKMTREAAQIFPLKDDQQYNVVSALSPTGNYTLTIDKKVVATGRAGTASPIQLGEGFTGPDLPTKTSPGNAILIAGPRDGGVNDCRDITFQAFAPEPH
ncbi:MAG TPA: hypothetical protein VGO11_01670 [Chthoniobacteraceae bacterium]|jgi:hypothetical protein|nr:hypothetical protein [Chthoniobacteraceae bacterium]